MSLFATNAQHAVHSTQAYLDIAAIKDGVVILKNGGLRAAIQVTSVNFALKSPAEQDDIVFRYQGFLNALHYPLQIVMQSRRLDLAEYLGKLRVRAEGETNEMIRTQTTSYIAFMEKLLSVVNIMSKQFYVIVPYDPPSLLSRSFLDTFLHPVKQVTLTMTEAEFSRFAAELDERVGIISSGLSSIGLSTGRLSTQHLIELFYATFNPEEAVKERLTNAIVSEPDFVGGGQLAGTGSAPDGEQMEQQL